MDKLLIFLEHNLSNVSADAAGEGMLEGVAGSHILDAAEKEAVDPIAIARVAYVRNLVSKSHKQFSVPDTLHPAERALMFLSFKDFERAEQALGLSLACRFVGAVARDRVGGVSQAIVADIQDLSCCSEQKDRRAKHKYYYDSFTFEDLTVVPLSDIELIFLYIQLSKIDFLEENASLRKEHMNAIINRALFEHNNLSAVLSAAFLLAKSEFSPVADKLEKYLLNPKSINYSTSEGNENISDCMDSIFCRPIIMYYEIMVSIGRSYMSMYDYGAAYTLLKHTPLFSERIECLINMRQASEAEKEIRQEITRIGAAADREGRAYLSNLYVRLGSLLNDPSCFDAAVKAFPSARPLQLKGQLYARRECFVEAASAFEEALRLSPNNEDVQFSYGCALIQSDNISQALHIFKSLKDKNPRNEAIIKNLSYCYYKMDDINAALDTLKANSLHDQSSLQQYLLISIRNSLIENTKWAISRIADTPTARESIAFLIISGKLTKSEVRSCMCNNPYFDDAATMEVLNVS